jgi:hypothetical protein
VFALARLYDGELTTAVTFVPSPNFGRAGRLRRLDDLLAERGATAPISRLSQCGYSDLGSAFRAMSSSSARRPAHDLPSSSKSASIESQR